MGYNYEQLDEHRFQQLAQALIVAEHPDTQCLPVAQPDGGRDAVRYRFESDGRTFIVFQVKFSRNAGNKTERDAVKGLITSERDKVRELIRSGAVRYYFITNVRGTAHLGGGSIDRVNKFLSDEFQIPCNVWWRDDLDRRLDNDQRIKWSYPDILRATDLLPLLLIGQQDPRKLRSIRAFKSYMATNYENDREVKFTQVGLKHSLIDLFVDLPISLKRRKGDREVTPTEPQERVPASLISYLSHLRVDEGISDEDVLAGQSAVGRSDLVGYATNPRRG